MGEERRQDVKLLWGALSTCVVWVAIVVRVVVDCRAVVHKFPIDEGDGKCQCEESRRTEARIRMVQIEIGCVTRTQDPGQDPGPLVSTQVMEN